MKNILLLLVLGFCLHPTTRACDFCGCGAGLVNPSILPQYHNNFIGLRYGLLSFQYPEYETIDQMASLELQFRFHVGPRLQLLGSLPFRQLTRSGSDADPSISGLGDASLLMQRRIFEIIDTSSLLTHQQLWLGIGGKLATGRSQINGFEELPAHFQVGTGTYDLQLTTNYQAQLGRLGLSLQSSWQKSISSNHGYFYGDQSRTSLLLFRRLGMGRMSTLMPSVGAEWEWIGKDQEDGYLISQSGGKAAFATFGLDWFSRRVALGARYRIPVYQNYAQGEIVAASRFSLNVNYLF